MRDHEVFSRFSGLIIFLAIICALIILPAATGGTYQPLELTSSDSDFLPECTSWVAIGSATADGRTMLHKNRDIPRQQEVVVYRKKRDKNAYLAISKDPEKTDVGAGINDHGLAVSCNFVSGINFGALGGMAPVGMNRKILEEADNVETAYAYIKKHRNRLIYEAVFCLADKNKAAIVECHSRGTSMEIKPLEECLVDGINGRPSFSGRSNYFDTFSKPNENIKAHNRRRFDRISEYLTSHAGSITPVDFFNLSRDHYYSDSTGEYKKGAPKNLSYTRTTGAICVQPANGMKGHSTISGVTFVIDPEFLELSTMWVALGSPDSTLYIPIHLSVMRSSNPEQALPHNWATDTAYDKAEKIRLMGWWKETTFSSCRDAFSGIETKICKAEKIARDKAREQLKNGDKSAAFAILNSFDQSTAACVDANLDKIIFKGTPPPWNDLPYPCK